MKKENLIEMFGRSKYDPIKDISQLLTFLNIAKALSHTCYMLIYQVDMLNYKVQTAYCEEWENLLEWDEVIQNEDFTFYMIGDLTVIMENEQN